MDYEPLSRQILHVSLNLRRGDRVWVNGWDHTTNLVSHLAQECRKRGCEVVRTIQSEAKWLHSLVSGPTSSLERLTPEQRANLEDADAYIFTLGPRHPVDWSKVPKERRSLSTIWLLEENEFVKEWKSIAARGRIKMLGIEATLATRERARALGIDFGAYEGSMYAGCLADSHQMARQAKRLSSVLKSKSLVRITTPTGTDLQFNLDNRPVEVSHGLVASEEAKRARPVFLPAGATGSTVNEESADGVIVYDHPIRSWTGTIHELKLRVDGGMVTDYSASSGAHAFREFLENNGAYAGRFAYVGFGLNPKLSLGYTQDDKVLGSVELNFGENQSRGGRNKGGRNFWGVVTRADVTINGVAVMKSGKLLV